MKRVPWSIGLGNWAYNSAMSAVNPALLLHTRSEQVCLKTREHLIALDAVGVAAPPRRRAPAVDQGARAFRPNYDRSKT